MKIDYSFVTGTVLIDVDVSPALEVEIKLMDQEEENLSKKYHRHTYSYDAAVYEGEDYGREDTYFDDDTHREMEERIEQIFGLLTPVQRRRVKKLVNGMTIKDIAASEGVKYKSVYDSLRAVKKKVEKFQKKALKKRS